MLMAYASPPVDGLPALERRVVFVEVHSQDLGRALAALPGGHADVVRALPGRRIRI